MSRDNWCQDIRVLVIDDELHVREELVFILDLIGFSTCSARSYTEARDILFKSRASNDTRIDAICLDLQLGSHSGLRVLEDVGRAWTEADRPVVVCLSGDHSGTAIKTAFECGADAYLTKPCSIEVLVGSIRSALEKREAEGFRADMVITAESALTD
jgi:DNA-binding response OmpR family regulator